MNDEAPPRRRARLGRIVSDVSAEQEGDKLGVRRQYKCEPSPLRVGLGKGCEELANTADYDAPISQWHQWGERLSECEVARVQLSHDELVLGICDARMSSESLETVPAVQIHFAPPTSLYCLPNPGVAGNDSPRGSVGGAGEGVSLKQHWRSLYSPEPPRRISRQLSASP
jgi:hypothetical protein